MNQAYLDTQIGFKNTLDVTALSGNAIYRFDPKDSMDVIPIHIRTGAQSLGYPTERKHFRAIEFHGNLKGVGMMYNSLIGGAV